MTVPNDELVQIGWTNQKFYRYPKVKRIQHHHTSFKTNAKGTSLERKHKKRIQKQTQNNKVKGKRIIYIITLNLNGLNAPTKWHTLAEWKQKHELYAVYKRPTSELGSHNRLRVRDWKDFMQKENKRKRSINTCIR